MSVELATDSNLVRHENGDARSLLAPSPGSAPQGEITPSVESGVPGVGGVCGDLVADWRKRANTIRELVADEHDQFAEALEVAANELEKAMLEPHDGESSIPEMEVKWIDGNWGVE